MEETDKILMGFFEDEKIQEREKKVNRKMSFWKLF